MPRREPTVHHPALMVTCPRCGCVPGALCIDTRGARLHGRVHRDRTDAHREHEAARRP